MDFDAANFPVNAIAENRISRLYSRAEKKKKR